MSNQLTFIHLRSFVTLAQERHYHRAADRLFISQPGLSKRIRQLEEIFEVSLFKRHTRKVELTFCGTHLYQEAEKMLRQADRLKRQLAMMHEGLEGEVRIGFVGSAMQQLIPDLVMQSNTLFPGIRFSLEEMSISRQIEALQKNLIDLGFVRLDQVPPGLKRRTVLEESFALVLPKDYPMEARDFKGLHQFQDESFILFSSEYSSSYYYNQIMSIFDNAGFTPKVHNRSINANIIFKLVGNGFGLAIVPASLTKDYNLPIKMIELVHIPQKARLSVVCRDEEHPKIVGNVLGLIKHIEK